MEPELILTLAATAAVSFATLRGPLLLLVRAVLRLMLPVATVRRWQVPVCTGLGAGIILATVVSGAIFGGSVAAQVAVLSLLVLMASLDLAWRWLPFEWTLPLLALGLIWAVIAGDLPDALIGLAVGGGVLLALHLFFHYARGVRALGIGDIWLTAGLGTLCGMPDIAYILSLAALTGLATAWIARFLPIMPRKQRFGVAYGTHLCVLYVVSLGI